MKTSLLLVLSAFIFTFTSCTKDCEDSANISDTSLESVTHSEDFVLSRTTHQDDGGEWKIKMNSVAAKAYAEGIKNFPSNSMIVKEKYVNGQMTGYAVMFRAPADKNSNDGWLWSEYDAEGHVIYSNAERGMNCQTCHATVSKTSGRF